MDHPIDRGRDRTVDPVEVDLPPLADHGDLVPCLDIESMVRANIHAMLNDTAYPQAHPVDRELGLFDTHSETDRPLLYFLGTDLIPHRFPGAKGCCKDKIAGSYQVLKVPEVVDALRHQPDLAKSFP